MKVSGTLVTGMPRAVAALTSTLSTPTLPSVMTLQFSSASMTVFDDPHALGVDGVRGFGGGDEFGLVGRRLDDLGADRIERLHFIVVTAAGDRETRAFRRHHPEFRHFLLPI